MKQLEFPFTNTRLDALSAAEAAIDAIIFITLLRVGAGMMSTTVGKEKIKNAVEKFLESLQKEGYLKIP